MMEGLNGRAVWRGFIFKLWSFSKKEKNYENKRVNKRGEGLLNDENLTIVVIIT